MKTIFINKFIVLVACLFVISCIDLTEKVYDQLTAEDYINNFSERDVPGAFGVVYSNLRNLYMGSSAHTGGCYLWTNEEVGDSWVTPRRGGAWYDGGIYYRLNQHKWNTDDAHMLGNWRHAYTGINSCNRLLFQFEDATTVDNIQSYLAELKVARAFWYYVLVDMYGNVPLVTKYDNPPDYLPTQSSRQEVFNFIVKEIEDNIDLLSNKIYGRWNKYSATHLLARIYLNGEVWTGTAYWDKVISLCNTIIESGQYQLEPDYKNPFRTANESSSEIIMGISNDEVYNTEANGFLIHKWTMHQHFQFHNGYNAGYWGGCCATPDLANSYHPEDLRFEKSWLEGQLYDNTGLLTGTIGSPIYCVPWDSRDAGKLLIYTKDIPLFEGDDPPGTGEAAGVRMYKYEIRYGALSRLSNDFVLFRYAEVLFMKAEAMYRKANRVANQEVVDLLNSVRKRAFTDFTGDKVLQVSELNDERFLQEYAWEFCQEGHRRQQMIRFGVFTTKTWFLHDSSEPHRVLFPIPRNEMLANPNLVQNPGYPTN